MINWICGNMSLYMSVCILLGHKLICFSHTFPYMFLYVCVLHVCACHIFISLYIIFAVASRMMWRYVMT